MTSPAGIPGVFDRAADTYDAVGVPWFGPVAQGLVEELDVRPGERVLDLGCGRGAALLPLARAAGPTGSALGLDLAPRMVELTARDARDLPQVEVRVGDASAPDVPEQAYDVVSCCLVLFFLPDPAARSGPGCRRSRPADGWASRPSARRTRAGGRSTTCSGPTCRPPCATRAPPARPFTSDEGVGALLTGAGLVDVRTAHRTVEAAFDSPEHWVEFSWSHGQRAMWEHVPERRAGRPADRALDLLREVERRDGGLRFRQDVRTPSAGGPDADGRRPRRGAGRRTVALVGRQARVDLRGPGEHAALDVDAVLRARRP
jgi:SAM-dependent methyltransferase